MRTIFFVLGFSVLFLTGYGQSVKEIKEQNVVNVLSKVDTLIFKRGNDRFLRIFMINNGSGSAGKSESDEVSHNFVICVSEYDEYPNKKIFTVGPFYDPVIIGEQDAKNGYVLEIQHGAPKRRNRIVVDGFEVKYQ